jgi:hypothetical protein
MPAVTRSQSRFNARKQQSVTIPECNNEYSAKYITDLETWFISTAKKYLNESCIMQKHKQQLNVSRKTAETKGDNKESKRLTKLYRSSYFDNIRLMDEFLYIIGQYLPILIKGPKFKNRAFTNTVYNKLNEFYKNIYYPRIDLEPKTASERKAVNSLKDTLTTTNRIIIDLLDSK